ncbi:uncharacterized protein SCHCODRAFT_02104961 [Schizophyllum commune H4-8]|nr:uncharacterized protein SCHCODRAFT_02104961 [Schizophyllum commune H4-8]KAI5886702.1 hypothetical protein SCHCODRAFT_02104961 [Schizophyllum commune H4-8]
MQDEEACEKCNGRSVGLKERRNPYEAKAGWKASVENGRCRDRRQELRAVCSRLAILSLPVTLAHPSLPYTRALSLSLSPSDAPFVPPFPFPILLYLILVSPVLPCRPFSPHPLRLLHFPSRPPHTFSSSFSYSAPPPLLSPSPSLTPPTPPLILRPSSPPLSFSFSFSYSPLPYLITRSLPRSVPGDRLAGVGVTGQEHERIRPRGGRRDEPNYPGREGGWGGGPRPPRGMGIFAPAPGICAPSSEVLSPLPPLASLVSAAHGLPLSIPFFPAPFPFLPSLPSSHRLRLGVWGVVSVERGGYSRE